MKYIFNLILALALSIPAMCQIGVIFLGEVPNKGDIVKRLKVVTHDVFGEELVVMNPSPIPATAYYKPRNRYRAEVILLAIPLIYERTLAVTSKDISTTKGEHYDWGIAGLASPYRRRCVVSTFRTKTMDSIIETCIHELGHTYGLQHCENECVMAAYNGSLKGTDKFCSKCVRKIR